MGREFQDEQFSGCPINSIPGRGEISGEGVGRAPSMAMLTFSKSMNVRDFLLDVVCTRMMVCLLSA